MAVTPDVPRWSPIQVLGTCWIVVNLTVLYIPPPIVGRRNYFYKIMGEILANLAPRAVRNFRGEFIWIIESSISLLTLHVMYLLLRNVAVASE